MSVVRANCRERSKVRVRASEQQHRYRSQRGSTVGVAKIRGALFAYRESIPECAPLCAAVLVRDKTTRRPDVTPADQ